MVPSDALFEAIPTWTGVYVLAAIGFSVAGLIEILDESPGPAG
jgi:hypothetical protein